MSTPFELSTTEAIAGFHLCEHCAAELQAALVAGEPVLINCWAPRAHPWVVLAFDARRYPILAGAEVLIEALWLAVQAGAVPSRRPRGATVH